MMFVHDRYSGLCCTSACGMRACIACRTCCLPKVFAVAFSFTLRGNHQRLPIPGCVGPAMASTFMHFTEKETELLKHWQAEGKPVREIAGLLQRDETTIRRQMKGTRLRGGRPGAGRPLCERQRGRSGALVWLYVCLLRAKNTPVHCMCVANPWTVDRPVDRPVDRSVDRCIYIVFVPWTVIFLK